MSQTNHTRTQELSSMALFGLETKLRKYLTEKFQAEINKKVDELVGQFMSEFSVNAESALDVYKNETIVVVKTFFNNEEQSKDGKHTE